MFIAFPQGQFFLYLQPYWFLSAGTQHLRDLMSLSDDRVEHIPYLELEGHMLDWDDEKASQVGDQFDKLVHSLKHKSNRMVFEVILKITQAGTEPEIKLTLWNNSAHVTSLHLVATKIRNDSRQISINFLLLSFLLQLSIFKRYRKWFLSV